MHGDDIELFRSIFPFEPLGDREVERFAGGIPVKVFERGRNVYTPAYRGDILFLLLCGKVRVYRAEGRHEIVLSIIRAGEIFGEAAFTDRRRKGAYAEVLETARVGLMSLKALSQIVGAYPQVGMRLVELLSERLAESEERLVAASLKRVTARLAGLILDLDRSEGVSTPEGRKIATRYTHEQLATMIGAKRVSVTRALTELQKSGVVDLRRRLIYINDIEALERAAA